MATLDYTLPLQVKSPDMMGILNQGSQLAQYYTQNKTEGELNRLYQESGGDLNKMLELGQQSKLARFVVPQIQAQQAARIKNQLDQQKTLAEIGEIEAHALERKANAGDTNQKTLINRQRAISSAIAAAMSGNPKAANFMLEHGKQGGILDDNSYTQAKQFLIENENNPEAISSLVKSLGVAAAEKPEQYIQPDANTVANNATSVANNVRTTNATMRGQDITADTADKNRAQNAQQFSQTQQLNEWLAKNKPIGTEMGNDGYMYAIYPGGKGVRISDERGTPIQAQQKGANSTIASQNEEKQRISRVNAVLDEIQGILPQATASYAGRGVDLLARGVGLATPGDVATGKLGTLGGQLVALMPKMSGPQSDKDVAMYKQMAGQLDDPTIPLQVRQAALETIRSLNNKYAEMNSQKGTTVPYRNDASANIQPQNQAKLNNILFGR
ncbi:hypothetical protein NT90_04215 [Acinetobacter baumannii]|nr:hypothetical protein NT90_04215 [Acinetobacter baumannii]